MGSLPSPDGPTLFIDRDTWSARLGAALAAAGIPHVAHRDHFPHDAPDPSWIEKVARRGWVIVTRDKAIRRRPAELAAYATAAACLFALTSGQPRRGRDRDDRRPGLAQHPTCCRNDGTAGAFRDPPRRKRACGQALTRWRFAASAAARQRPSWRAASRPWHA
jgi:hypothetical protein